MIYFLFRSSFLYSVWPSYTLVHYVSNSIQVIFLFSLIFLRSRHYFCIVFCLTQTTKAEALYLCYVAGPKSVIFLLIFYKASTDFVPENHLFAPSAIHATVCGWRGCAQFTLPLPSDHKGGNPWLDLACPQVQRQRLT